MKTTLLLVFAALTSHAWAANIIVVSSSPTNDTDITNALAACGHTITTVGNAAYRDSNNGGAADATNAAALNAADLIIFTRNSNSGDYDANVAAWDAITTPIIMANSYISRDSRWQWFSDSTLATGVTTNTDVLAIDPTAPIYTGLTGTPSFPLYSGSIDLPGATSMITGTGQIWGTTDEPAGAENIVAAAWLAGGMTGSGNVLGGDRYFFVLPGQSSDDLSMDGDTAFKNLVTAALPVPEPSRAILVGLGLTFALLRRRR